VYRVDVCALVNAHIYVSMCVYVHVGDKSAYGGVYVGKYLACM